MMCPTCRAVDLSEIRLHLRGCEVILRACVRCEKRWWHQDGEPVALDDVLALARPQVTINA